MVIDAMVAKLLEDCLACKAWWILGQENGHVRAQICGPTPLGNNLPVVSNL